LAARAAKAMDNHSQCVQLHKDLTPVAKLTIPVCLSPFNVSIKKIKWEGVETIYGLVSFEHWIEL